MNMLSVLPVSGWGKKEEIRAIWEAVTSIVVANSGVYSLSVHLCVFCCSQMKCLFKSVLKRP